MCKQDIGMEEDIKFGVMAVFMKDIGRVIKLMVVGDLFMLMVIFTMVNGRMIRHMVSVNTLILMEQSTKDIG